MRGKRKVKKQKISPDQKYNSVMVARFINKVMVDGKKSIARKIVYGALADLETKTKQLALDAFEKVINNVKPILEIRSKRIGGATYQVPIEVPSTRSETLAMRWIITAARGKKGKGMANKLFEEFASAYNKEGSAMKKRSNVHKMAEANKAFAHFARF